MKKEVGWRVATLGEVAKFENGGAFSERVWGRSGLPIIRIQNLNGSEEFNYYDGPVPESIKVQNGDILFGWSGSRGSSFGAHVWRGPVGVLNQHIFKVTPRKGVRRGLLAHLLAFHTRDIERRAHGAAGLVHVTKPELLRFKVSIPVEEAVQVRMERALAALETRERATVDLIAAKRRLKRALMQRLFITHGRGQKGFKQMKAGAAFSERDERGSNDLPLLSVTGSRGVVARDDLERRDTSSEDKSAYKRVVPGDIVYNTMRMWQGVCGLVTRGGIVSPAYTVLTPARDVSARYCAQLFKQPRVISLLRRYSQGLVDDTLNLKYSQFSRISLSLPGFPRQEQVASLLELLDLDAAATEDLLATLRLQKRGVMQKLLSGQLQ